MSSARRIWPRLAAAAALASALAGCAAPNIWAKPGISAVQTDADGEACLAIAEGRADTPVTSSGGGAAGYAGASAAAGFVDTIAKYKARDACIEDRGYRRLTITDEEASRLSPLRGAERVAYQQQLLEKYGVAGPGGSASPAPQDATPAR